MFSHHAFLSLHSSSHDLLTTRSRRSFNCSSTLPLEFRGCLFDFFPVFRVRIPDIKQDALRDGSLSLTPQAKNAALRGADTMSDLTESPFRPYTRL